MLYMSPAVWRYSELLTSHEKSIRFVTDWLAAFTEHLDQPSLYGLAKDYVSYNTFKKELVWNFLKNRTRWEKQQTILHFSIFSLSVYEGNVCPQFQICPEIWVITYYVEILISGLTLCFTREWSKIWKLHKF